MICDELQWEYDNEWNSVHCKVLWGTYNMSTLPMFDSWLILLIARPVKKSRKAYYAQSSHMMLLQHAKILLCI